jgi:2-oxoglutarate/2-oxoacid ferredoxin oxidoreductase subunit beta
MESHDKGETLTGVFYIDTQKTDFTTLLNMVDEPLATLAAERVRPAPAVLAELMSAHS